MRRPSTRWIVLGAIGVLVVAAAAIGGFASGGSGSGGGSTTVATGRPAPAWSGTTLTGRTLSLQSERGHWVVLNFFATWCHPCQQETPELARIEASHRAEVIGVLYDDSTSDARSFVADHHVTWPLVGDPGGSISSHYKVVGLPISYLINPQGTVVRQVFGGVKASTVESLLPG